MSSWRIHSRGRRLSPKVAFVLAVTTSIPRSAAVLPSSSLPMPAFALSSVWHSTTRTHQRRLAAPHTTTCYAKLNTIASTFDLDAILSNERESAAADAASAPAKRRRGRNRNNKKDEQKKQRKEQQQKQRLEREQAKHRMKTQSSSETDQNTSWKANIAGESDDEPDIDYRNLVKSIDFLAFEVPSQFNGKRIDTALVDLLNHEQGATDAPASNPISISRSQCGTLLSNDCIFVVPPEAAPAFRAAQRTHPTEIDTDGETAMVRHDLIERHGAPIRRKSHPLEASSLLLYPSRQSLLRASSSALLSNFLPPTEIVAQNIPLDVLYEDEHMIVINKMAGMVVHPAAGNWDGTLVNALAYYLTNDSPHGAGEFFADDATGKVGTVDSATNVATDDADANQNDAVTNSVSALRPGIVHRLDKGTTGVLVVAKTASALATLSAAFAERKVKKEYLAITIGNPGDDQWINKPIGRHPLHRQRMRVVPDPSAAANARGQARASGAVAKPGRTALSHVHTAHHDGKLSVVRVRIATGRTHQIRVHLQDHGTPIYGDEVYGLSDWNKALSAQRGVTRPLLHAQRLEIEHPVTGEGMVFEAPVADDMWGVMKTIMPAEN